MASMNHYSPRNRQSGAVLLVAVVLLLLAGVMTLFALNVGVFEQRSTANDLRAKMVNEVAEAGLAQGFEFLMRQHPAWLDDDSKWTQCGSADTKFPCGAVPEFEADGTTARRSTMYRYELGAAIPNIDAALSNHMLPLANALTTVGQGFSVAYGVAPLLCRVARPVTGAPKTTPIRCTTDVTKATKQRIGTFVSVATIPGEGARTTLVQTVGRYSLLEPPLGLPPMTASGSVDITGGLNVVTNPNGAGAGVPVSVWTRRNVDKGGNPNTCYMDEFLRSSHGVPNIIGGTTKIQVCDDCDCDADTSLSFTKAGNLPGEGIDILDIDSNVGDNRDVKPAEFPCDLFQYVFNVAAWRDDSIPKDNFCETRLPKAAFTPDWNQLIARNIYPDEAFLYKNAGHIILNSSYPDAVALTNSSGKVVTTSYLDTGARGIVWCQLADCGLGSPGLVIGSPDHPVLLVADATTGTTIFVKAKIYGMLFIRTNSDGPLNADSSNAATYRMNAGGIIYGALVVQGIMEKANGHAAVVYSGDVLSNLFNDADNIKYATLPGAWTDQKSY